MTDPEDNQWILAVWPDIDMDTASTPPTEPMETFTIEAWTLDKEALARANVEAQHGVDIRPMPYEESIRTIGARLRIMNTLGYGMPGCRHISMADENICYHKQHKGTFGRLSPTYNIGREVTTPQRDYQANPSHQRYYEERYYLNITHWLYPNRSGRFVSELPYTPIVPHHYRPELQITKVWDDGDVMYLISGNDAGISRFHQKHDKLIIGSSEVMPWIETIPWAELAWDELSPELQDLFTEESNGQSTEHAAGSVWGNQQ